VRIDEREDHLGVDGHVGLVALDPVSGEELLVVRDDPVVDPGHPSVPDRVVVRRDRRMPLRVVADVDQRLAGGGGEDDRVEQRARSRLLLVDDEWAVRAVRVADGVGAPLRDPGQQGLCRERSVHSRGVAEAVASDAAHVDVSYR
jgi:hypothetical protein